MESYTPKNFDDDKKPDKTGESNASKKKKKKPSVVPLPVETEATTSPKKVSELFIPASEKENEENKEAETNEALELPEVVSNTEEATPFLGELIIDHTGESTDETVPTFEEVEPVELPEDTEAVTTEQVYEALDSEPVTTVDIPETTPAWEQTMTSVESEQPMHPDQTAGSASFGELFNPSHREVEQAIATPAPDMVPAKEVRRRTIRAEKRGLSRGVASGALAGWWFGRRSGRHQGERQQQVALQNHEQTAEQAQAKQTWQAQEAKRRELTMQHTIDQLKHVVSRNIVHAKEAVAKPKPDAMRPRSEEVERMTLPLQESSRVAMEQPRITVEERPVTEEMLQAPEGNRYESSAWHRIEVDEKTGRLVEKPTQAYGEAFVQEQQQERLAREAVKSQTAAQVAMTLAASSTSFTSPASILPEPPMQNTGYVAPAIQTESDAEFIKQQLLQRSTSPVTWGIALLIFVTLLVVGVL